MVVGREQMRGEAVAGTGSWSTGNREWSEARHAESRADFVHKVAIASKELAEAKYWLLLIDELGLNAANPRLADEADQLGAILSASARTARSRAAPDSTPSRK